MEPRISFKEVFEKSLGKTTMKRVISSSNGTSKCKKHLVILHLLVEFALFNQTYMASKSMSSEVENIEIKSKEKK